MKALVIEPSRMYQLLLTEFLNGHSVSHEVVQTGKDAIAALKTEKVDIIIIAMTLADTNATDLAASIKKQSQYADAVIIVMTGEHDKAKLQRMKTPDVNYICQRNEMTQFKNILTDLTHDDISSIKVQGHILYVEDHLSVANMTMDILNQMGLTFEHCSSAEEGLLLIEQKYYDLVLLDIVLAGAKDGITMIEEIRARDDNDDKHLTPILALSASSTAGDRIKALKAGANDFISKPILQAELAVRAKNLIDARQLYLKLISQQEALETLAMTDQLTELYNRYFLDSFINKALNLAKRHKYPISFVVIDLDKFKYINDTFGHEQGDEVLVKISDVLKSNCRVEDIAVRLGGDEFLIVLPHCSPHQAVIKAQDICQKFNAIEARNKEVVVAASFGVSSTEQGNFNYKELFELADQAAYQSKSAGGNTVHLLEK